MRCISLFFHHLLLLLFLFSDLCNTHKPKPTTNNYLKLSLFHHNPIKSPLISGARTGSGQYFAQLQLGTPPQTLLLILDTGSDLVWVQCSFSKNNNHSSSLFLPHHSSSFSPHHCYSSHCKLITRKPAPCTRTRIHSPCLYQYSYADGSVTTGFFSKETTTFSGRKVREFSFGCAFRVSGRSFNGAHGVMGLGRGPVSFSSQLGRRFGNRFSYCLMDYTLSPPPTSFLVIGGVSNVSGVKYTPLLINSLSPTFYYVGIESVFVDGVKLPIHPAVWSIDDRGNGGTVVDSGTTLSFLPELAYREVLTAFKRRVKVRNPVELTPGFDLCVNVSGLTRLSLPRMSFRFAGGSVFSPPPRNYFIETEDRVKCLAVRPVDSENGFSVIGNLMQQGFLLEFDKEASRLGFSRRGCAIP